LTAGTEHLPNSKDSRTAPEAQGNRRWTYPSGTLGQLVGAAAARGAELEAREAELERLALDARPVASLETALHRTDLALLAELKRSSPSRGAINPGLDSVTQARAYERGGAAAISVLTERERFGGADTDLESVARTTSLPILRKDFHVTPAQLFQARAMGASAALLIARALPPSRFADLVMAADSVGLEVVAEVRDMVELGRALAAGARIIGVNNRNLETLRLEPRTAEAIIPRIPREYVAIAESGYSDRSSVEAAAGYGADAVLIGSFLSAAVDPESAVRGLTGVKKVARAE
jgi:indole-3-glycerol phosphate synthase